MRKWVACTALLLLIAVLLTGPLVSGILFRESYSKLLSSYHSQNNVQITMVDYQRGWFNSDVTLKVVVKKDADLQNGLKTLNILTNNLPPAYEFIIQQHIQHGPIMYRNIRYLPSLFGMVAIQNNFIWSSEIKSLFAEIGISGVIVKSDYDFVTYSGDYFNYFELLIEKIQLANQSICPIRDRKSVV